MILSWGKPSKFQFATSTSGKPGTDWKDIETPKDGTMQITVTEGTETTALEEGGGLVDSRFAANTYELVFQEFVKKGKEPVFEDADGVIAGEYAFRFLPEDEDCEGRLIERATVRVQETFTTADGILREYHCRCLKPATGNTVKKAVKADFSSPEV